MTNVHTSPLPTTDSRTDVRPRFGIGHVMVSAHDVSALTDFYTRIGFRLVVDMGNAAILELRGGTHIVIRSGPSGRVVLDLIVDDVDETRDVLIDTGANPSEIMRGHPHDRFTVLDPEGNTLVVNSNHAIGPV